MKLSDFFYNLPKELIAQQPINPRDHSRLLVLDRKNGRLEHKHFFDLLDLLKPGDVLVLNDSKVIPARLIGKKTGTGGKLEIFLLKKISQKSWQCLIGGKNRQEEQEIIFSKNFHAKVIKRQTDGTWLVNFNLSGKRFSREIERVGQVPLPPYIKRNKPGKADRLRYQTVYVNDCRSGSVAAPTAGLHFTSKLLKKIKASGIDLVYLTLHVGLGTFLPVKSENIREHTMHPEWYELDKSSLRRIENAKKAKHRIIAVGTTSARVLETVFKNKAPQKLCGWTDIFIYPGHKFKAVDALITNFHLPGSSLLMLVSAFAGQTGIYKSVGIGLIKKAYREAVKRKYRFFSYGDAMLIK